MNEEGILSFSAPLVGRRRLIATPAPVLELAYAYYYLMRRFEEGAVGHAEQRRERVDGEVDQQLGQPGADDVGIDAGDEAGAHEQRREVLRAHRLLGAGVQVRRNRLVELGREAETVISRASAIQAPTTLLKILYASESGNAAALARQIEGKVGKLGLRVAVEDLARYKTRGLAEERTVLFVASTHGEGEPPDVKAYLIAGMSEGDAQ